MNADICNILSASPIFLNIPPEKIKEMFSRIPYKLKNYKKGNTVAFRGQKYNELIILIKGTVKGEMTDIKGKAVEIEKISAPRPLAPAFLFGNQNILPVDIVASNGVLTLSIPRNSLIRLFQANPILLTHFLDAISNRAQFLSERLWLMSFKTIKEKIAYYILNRSKPNTQFILLSENQKELSEFFGITRPSLSRVFAELKKSKIILYSRKKIHIKNRDKLEQMVRES